MKKSGIIIKITRTEKNATKYIENQNALLVRWVKGGISVNATKGTNPLKKSSALLEPFTSAIGDDI